MTDLINVDADAMAAVLGSLTKAAEELDSVAGDLPFEVDAGAASLLVSGLVGDLIDASIRVIAETSDLVDRAEGALDDLSEFERTTSASLSSFTMEAK